MDEVARCNQFRKRFLSEWEEEWKDGWRRLAYVAEQLIDGIGQDTTDPEGWLLIEGYCSVHHGLTSREVREMPVFALADLLSQDLASKANPPAESGADSGQQSGQQKKKSPDFVPENRHVLRLHNLLIANDGVRAAAEIAREYCDSDVGFGQNPESLLRQVRRYRKKLS